MNIKYNNEVVGTVITNHSMTIEEALYAIGYDINDATDLQKAYDDGFAAAYVDDEGNAQIDIDALEME